jgi:hypothetical protein
MRVATRIMVAVALLTAASVGCEKQKEERAPFAHEQAKEFVYPEASKLRDSYGGGIDAVYLATFVTPDSGDKVIDWYQEKFSHSARPRGEGICWSGFGGYAIMQDAEQPKSGEDTDGKPRPVSVWVFTRQTKLYTVTVTVSRAEGEKHTHIVLTLTQHPPR